MKNEYFKWLCHFIDGKDRKVVEYRKLLLYLYEIPFTYDLVIDNNRAQDGIDLRYRFADERNYKHAEVCYKLDNRDCSVLEMLIALSIRCEDIMYDRKNGDTTYIWFWQMLDNLDLLLMTERYFDEETIIFKVNRFLNREYSPEGDGNIFYIPGCGMDLRKVEIWYQAMSYLNYILEG